MGLEEGVGGGGGVTDDYIQYLLLSVSVSVSIIKKKKEVSRIVYHYHCRRRWW